MVTLIDSLEMGAERSHALPSGVVAHVWGYLRPQAGRLVAVGTIVLLAAGAEAALPIALARSLDHLESVWTAATVAGAVVLLGALGWVLNYVRARLTARAIVGFVRVLHESAFEAMLLQSLSYHDSSFAGSLVNRVSVDVLGVARFVTLAADLFSQAWFVMFLVAFMLHVDLLLTVVTLSLAPIIIGVAAAFRHVARSSIRRSREVHAEVAAQAYETVSGIAIAKAFAQEDSFSQRFAALSERVFRVDRRLGYVLGALFPTLGILTGLGRAIIAYIGGGRVASGSSSLADWYLFIQAVQLYWVPMTAVAFSWSQVQVGLASAERVLALFEQSSHIRQCGCTALANLEGKISFERVRFGYNAERLALDDVSFNIAPGETVAIVGHTGSGKSTIARLLARLYEYQAGDIRIDGHDLRSLDLVKYRTHLGIVTQTPLLFDVSVMENIRYGRLTATDAEVREVAYRVGEGDWIAGLADGLDTRVGERGANLSMGQRQLVSLARVILQRPSIFIQDEATASVDPLTEALIQEGLAAILSSCTSIIIAHRLSTIKRVDRILVMKQGKLVEQGSHAELLSMGGTYAGLYRSHFQQQSAV